MKYQKKSVAQPCPNAPTGWNCIRNYQSGRRMASYGPGMAVINTRGVKLHDIRPVKSSRSVDVFARACASSACAASLQPDVEHRRRGGGRVLRGRHHRRQGAADPTSRPLACCAADGMPQLDTARRCGGVAGGAPWQLLGCCDGLLARRGRLQHTRASPDGALVRPACGCVARARGHDCIAAPAAARELTALHRPLTRALSSQLITHRLL